MSSLVIRLSAVRNAVDQSARMGMPETQRDVVRRMLEDARHGLHGYHESEHGIVATQLRKHRLARQRAADQGAAS